MAPELPPLPTGPSWLARADALAAALGVDRRRVLAGGAVVVAAVAVVAFVLLGRVSHQTAHTPPESAIPRAKPGASGGGDVTPTSSGPLVVAAAGAVAHAGVYRVPPGSRVIDVVQAAGGPTADADLDRVNLAAKVNDGDRIYVARKGEAADPGASTGGSPDSTAPAILDLNTATAAQLDALPGVGPSTAQAIVEYRTQHGRFHSVDELMEVRGIGESKLAQIRPHVRV